MNEELQSLLLSEHPLLISADGYRQLMVSAFPLGGPAATVAPRQDYRTHQRAALQTLQSGPQPATDGVSVTDDYESDSLPEGTIAYHRVWGPVTAASHWYFSSKQLERDLLAAEQNPLITCHLLHVNSPGGEAWYLDRLSQTMASLEKPLVTLYEMACSAAYLIACHGRRVYATTQFDLVGCIGTMVSVYDFSAYYERLGIRVVEAKATASDLKNKMFDDLLQGKPKQYVERVLNPQNDQFLTTVRRQRKALADLPADHPVLRGETYYTAEACDLGLCDGQRTLAEVLEECRSLGRDWQQASSQKRSLYQQF